LKYAEKMVKNVKNELYDTNVLIHFWRKGRKDIQGNTTILNIIEFPKALMVKNLITIYPNPDDLNTVLKILKDLMRKRTPITRVNIIPAAIALNRNLTILTKDKDFKLIKAVRPHLKLRIIKD